MEEIKVLSSKQARARWRDIMDVASAGEAVVIKRYGKPTAAVIPFEDYQNLQDELDDLRAARRAAAIYKEWKRDPATARPWSEVKAELTTEGIFDNEDECTH
jgi:prevent-host-death family protein